MFASGSGGRSGRDDDDDFGFDEDYAAADTPAEPQPRPQRAARTGGGDTNGRRRTVQFEPEERYWTDYLRIALPVIGLLLMIGLLWFWAQQIISDDPDTTEPNPTEEIGLVTTTESEPTEETLVSTPAANNQGAQDTGTTAGTEGQQEQLQETPPPDDTSGQQTTGADNQSAEGQAEEPQPTGEPAAGGEIGIDSAVIVTQEGDGLNLRPDPSTTGEPVTQLAAGEQLTVIGGPQEGENYVWWEVVTSDGTSGWVAQDFIEPAQ